MSELVSSIRSLRVCPYHQYVLSNFYAHSSNTNQTPPTLHVTEAWECEICSGHIKRNKVGLEVAKIEHGTPAEENDQDIIHNDQDDNIKKGIASFGFDTYL